MIARDIASGHTAGQQPLGRLDLAVRHLPLASARSAKLASGFETGSRSLHDQFPLRFSQACHDVEEEAAGGGCGCRWSQ